MREHKVIMSLGPLLVAFGAVAVMFGVVAAGPASAGGWAVTTLDSVPDPQANQTVEVGFTIRQHGVTPVDPGGEVGIALRSSTGETRFFAAESDGVIGHFVATVTFPEDGSWTWAVRQGPFRSQDLGAIEIASAAGGSGSTAPAQLASGTAYRWPLGIRAGLPALALLLGAGAVLDLARGRRRVAVA